MDPSSTPSSWPAGDVRDDADLAMPPGAGRWHLQGRPGPLTGQVFGDYELGGVLGEGGMGTIYRAWQSSLARPVAVKTLSSAYAQDPAQRGRFEMEARTASRIRSPHVVQVHGAGSYNDIAYFVMEFVAGTALGDLIARRSEARRPFPPAEAADLILQAARGLAVAASQHVVHRDIKPANMLIDRAGTLKIADFGISKITGENSVTRTGTTLGTPSYVSPEQGRGEPVDARSDLYSLGVVFYELLVLRKPFTGTTANALIYQHNYAEPRLPRDIDPTIPEAYQAVVIRLLQKVPDRRYQSAADLVRDLEGLRAGNRSLTALLQATYGTGAEEMMRRHLGRQRRWVTWTVAALLVVAIAAVGGLGHWLGTDHQRRQAEAELARRHERLRRDLDLPALVPANALADIAAYAASPSAVAADVQRWRAKVAAVERLRRDLGRLDGTSVPGCEERRDCEDALNRLEALTGGGYAGELVRWRGRLRAVDDQIAELKSRFAAEERLPSRATLVRQRALEPYLLRLGQLAGSQDPVYQHWTRAFAATTVRCQELEQDMERLAQDRDLTVAAAGRLKGLLDDHLRLAGLEPRRMASWRARIQMVAEEQARLTESLERLDRQREPILDEILQVESGTSLQRWRELVGGDDARLPRWQARVTASRVRTTALRQRLQVLDDATAVRTRADLAELRVIADEYRPLARPDDPRMHTWERRLAVEEAALSDCRASLARLAPDKPEPLGRAEAARLARAFAQAQMRLALSSDEQEVYATRLREEDRRYEALRLRLGGIRVDQARLHQVLVEDIGRFGRLVGGDDPLFQAWSQRVRTYQDLHRGLARLDERAPLPDRAREMLAAFAAETVPDSGEVRRWTAKLARVEELTRSLAVLDRPAPIPATAAADLDALVDLLGDSPVTRKWRDRIRQVDALTTRLHQRLDRSCLPDPSLDQDYAILAGCIGDSSPAMRRWRRHLQELVPPPRPAWAMVDGAAAKGFAADGHGHGAVLMLGSALLRLRWVPAGRFTMGSPLDEAGRDADESPVEVVLSRGFWLAETETTQRQWRAVMGCDPSDWCGDDHPVERVSHGDALAFCARAAIGAGRLRLPSEAEWEYACRAGSTQPFSSFQGDLEPSHAVLVGWMRGAHDGHAPVARRQPNRLGLYDMHGNVWEWCADRYGPYSPTGVVDPLGSTAATQVIRGGSWGDPPERCRAANRQQAEAGLRSAYLGFRVAIDGP